MIFVDPYDRSDGMMPVGTPVPYRKVVDPAMGTVRLLASGVPWVALLVVIFPLSLLALGIHYAVVTHRIEDRLLRLMQALPPAPTQA